MQTLNLTVMENCIGEVGNVTMDVNLKRKTNKKYQKLIGWEGGKMEELKRRTDKMKHEIPYNPQEKSRLILERAWELVDATKYKVNLRWLFYRLYQEDYYKKKTDYTTKFDPLMSKARKRFYKKWTPDTLVDQTREPIFRAGGGRKSVEDWFSDIPDKLADKLLGIVDLEHFYRQDYYVEVWFEAVAMAGQFKYYTEGVNLRPFGGQYSISRKWEAAQALKKYAQQFDKPAVVLYFGDCDKAGKEIPKNALKDIEPWCYDFDFKFIPCGLTIEQAEEYELPSSIDNPNNYQWEALPDDKARELITSNIDKYVDRSIIKEVWQERWNFAKEWKPKVIKALEKLFEDKNQ